MVLSFVSSVCKFLWSGNPHKAFVLDFKLACIRKQGESWSYDYDWWSRGGADLELAIKFWFHLRRSGGSKESIRRVVVNF